MVGCLRGGTGVSDGGVSLLLRVLAACTVGWMTSMSDAIDAAFDLDDEDLAGI